VGDSIEIHRRITIKAVLTESLKEELVGELREAIKGLDMETQRLEFEFKRIMNDVAKVNPQHLQAIRHQLELEKRKRQERKEELAQRLKEIEELELGSEIVRGTIEGPVVVRPGDDWNSLFQAEIVIRDGVVQEVRP